MGITAAQRKKLIRQGWSRSDLRELADVLDDDDETDDGEVTVLRGKAARGFLERLGFNDDDEADETDDDEATEDDDPAVDEVKARRRKPRRKATGTDDAAADDEAEDDDDAGGDDEKPPAGHKYFR